MNWSHQNEQGGYDVEMPGFIYGIPHGPLYPRTGPGNNQRPGHTATDASNKLVMDPGIKDPRPDLIDAIYQRQIITRLEERGVDAPRLEAEMKSGDGAVKAELETHFQASMGEMPSDPPTHVAGRPGCGQATEFIGNTR